MSVTVRIAMSPESLAVIERHRGRAGRLAVALRDGLRQSVEEGANHVKMNMLSGTYTPGARRGGSRPVALRSGNLRQAIIGVQDQPLSGFVGVSRGVASKYARTILGSDTTTITPRSARNLWIPVADNLSKSGQPRMTPRDAMSQTGPTGKRLLRIFRSRAGNLVAFLPDAKGGTYTKGTKKGMQRGKLLFVLKQRVEIQGTDALAVGVGEKASRFREILQGRITGAMA